MCDLCGEVKEAKTAYIPRAKKHKCKECHVKYTSELNSKPVTLQNFKDGRVISAKSITKFCKSVKLGRNARFHFADILNGKRFHHKGWHLPIPKVTYWLQDINGHTYKFDNFIKFCKEYGKSPTKIKMLLDGKIPYYAGLFLSGNRPKNVKPERRKYVVTFKKGRKNVSSDNIAEIARAIDKNVDYSGFRKAALGLLLAHKGWRVSKVTPHRLKKLYVKK